MKSKKQQLVKPTTLDSLKIKKSQILSGNQLKFVVGGNSAEAATIAATIRAANS
ncbi:MAG TPA: hypothetical protein VF465_06245 [Flavobacterium sp.]|uniref:hypothetical protein n=1 Tax=Flavobacterium sp. TaxID=239 RepID=UPI002ED3C644